MNEDAKRWIYWAIPIAVVIGLGVALYYGRKQQQADIEPAAQTEPKPASAEPPVRHPLPEDAEPAPPLPPLAESDSTVQEALGRIFGQSLEPFLVPENIVRNFVVTVDNLPRRKTAVQMWPVQPTPGELVSRGPPENLVLSEANYARYAPIVKVVQNADTAQLAAMYRRYYPLFQQAYVDLGYPEGYFNDRLIEVIDHLLATPDVSGPIRLTRPSVYYTFADASLEERSAGQKLLIRMGGQNAAIVKTKLRELRDAVTEKRADAP